MKALSVALVLMVSCGGAGGVQRSAPYDALTLDGVTALCERAVRRGCERDDAGPVESCTVLRGCDAVIDEWERGSGGRDGGK